MCFVVHKTTLELERAILTSLYLAGAKNTYSGKRMGRRWEIMWEDVGCVGVTASFIALWCNN
jgi:hypothetical protein